MIYTLASKIMINRAMKGWAGSQIFGVITVVLLIENRLWFSFSLQASN